jgi:cytochrome c-type biogenesis protein CcmF
MKYIGEHTFVGQLGNFFVVLAFTAAILAALSYFFANIRDKQEEASWKKLGRLGFYVHSLAVLGIIATMFHMLFNHYFEYDYVYKHSNTSMDMKYIFSCFWEGQEGSFLLWSFWHVVLGLLLMHKSGKWEAPVMTTFSTVQIFLGTMLLGVYVFDIRIGSNPFVLIRELPENVGLPWTRLPNYLELIPQFSEGRGLNPLLQNYWMTIHPPTLFLGFASTLVPFSFAIAGLWKKDLKGWMEPALPWTFFSIGVLGLGILMGGAWAYEALSFGGFWAWDPVENASLVPWLTLVGAGHLMLVNKRKETSLFTTFYLTLGTFVLILYSTFLTRSGVLGDTSVHSFTDNGMLGQLLLYLIFFVFISVYLLLIDNKLKRIYLAFGLLVLVIGISLGIQNAMVSFFAIVSSVFLIYGYQKYFPKPKQEEQFWSREFWMFIGALVLLISAAQITFETSKPVYNILARPFSGVFSGLYESTSIEFFKGLAEGTIAPHSDVISHYNKWQIPFAFLVTLLIAVANFLRYKQTDSKEVIKKLTVSFLVSVALTLIIAIGMRFEWKHFSIIALLFSTIFAVAANTDYLLKFIGKKSKIPWGSGIAHIGFGLLLLGALLSTYKQIEISENTSGIDITMLSDDFSNKSDILIFQGDTLGMNEYFIHYKGKRKDGIHVKIYHRIFLMFRNRNLSTRGFDFPMPENVFEAKSRPSTFGIIFR